MENDEIFAWNFYCHNAVPFVQEYGLMVDRVRRVGLKGVARETFEGRLSFIHQRMMEIRMRGMEEEQRAGAERKPGDIVLVGNENG
jgi:hypothetical protein